MPDPEPRPAPPERGPVTLESTRPVPPEWIPSLTDPPTSIDPRDLTLGKKYLLLVAGEAIVTKLLVDVGPPAGAPALFAHYEYLPESQVPAGKKKQGEYVAPEFMAGAWKALLARYSAQDFKDAGWELVALRATSAASIDAALAAIAAAQPQALAVHYFDHGSSVTSGGTFSRGHSEPYLAIRTEGWTTLKLPDPNGTPQSYTVFGPQPDVSRYYTRNLARKIQADFPRIPLLLILDGCELAPSLDFATPRLSIVVSVDRALCGTNIGLFSQLLAGPVIPVDFDQPRSSMPAALAAVNPVLTTYPVGYIAVEHWSWLIGMIFGVKKDLRQRASMTHWLWP